MNFVSRVIMSPLMPTVEKDLNLTHVQSGSLFLMITIGYFITMAGNGFVSSRVTHRRIITISSFTLGIALIWISLTETLSGLRWALILLGLATGPYLPSGITTITSLIRRQNWGKALAVHELAPNLGLLTAPLLAELFILYFTWHTTVAFLGVVSIALGLVHLKYGRGGEFIGDPPKASVMKKLISRKEVWIMVVLFSLGVGASMGVYNMLPLYMVEEGGFGRESANTWLAVCRITGLFMAFVSGWFTDRIGPKITLAGALLTAGIATIMLGLTSGHALIVAIFFQSALTACFFPAGQAALSYIGRASERGLVVSIVVPIGFMVGCGIFPAIIGYFGEHYTFALGMLISGIMIVAGPILITRLRLKEEV